MSTPSFSDDSSATFFIRWRGREDGPYTGAAIETKMATNQIGLLHEICHNGQWVTLREYLAQRESAYRAAEQARIAREKRDREELERKKAEAGLRLVQKPGASIAAASTKPSRSRLFKSRSTRIVVNTLIILACAGAGIWIFLQFFAK